MHDASKMGRCHPLLIGVDGAKFFRFGFRQQWSQVREKDQSAKYDEGIAAVEKDQKLSS